MSVNTELLKNRDFRNTLFAIGANQLSDSMSYITTPIIILALTGSPEAASITLFIAGVLATCAGAVSGTWVDRIGPSKCLALSCIGQSLSWIAILLYLVFNVTNILRFSDYDFSSRHHFHLRLPKRAVHHHPRSPQGTPGVRLRYG